MNRSIFIYLQLFGQLPVLEAQIGGFEAGTTADNE
jgi:hypothetical protein